MERNIENAYIERHARPIILLLAILTASLMTIFVLYRTEAKAQSEVQMAIAGEVLRFHILANSDSGEDQALKLKVRDRVIAFMEENMAQDLSAEETKDWVRGHLDELEEIGQGEVAAQNRTDLVSAAVTTCYFPEKTYGELTFPAGNYEALRIEIGAAKGHNWWCVLYPGICFEDAVRAVMDEQGANGENVAAGSVDNEDVAAEGADDENVAPEGAEEESQRLSHVLTEEEYSHVTAESDFEIRSYFFDNWNR